MKQLNNECLGAIGMVIFVALCHDWRCVFVLPLFIAFYVLAKHISIRGDKDASFHSQRIAHILRYVLYLFVVASFAIWVVCSKSPMKLRGLVNEIAYQIGRKSAEKDTAKLSKDLEDAGFNLKELEQKKPNASSTNR